MLISTIFSQFDFEQLVPTWMLVLCEIFKCYFVVVYTKVVCKVQGLHTIHHWKNYKVRYDFIVFKKKSTIKGLLSAKSWWLLCLRRWHVRMEMGWMHHGHLLHEYAWSRLFWSIWLRIWINRSHFQRCRKPCDSVVMMIISYKMLTLPSWSGSIIAATSWNAFKKLYTHIWISLEFELARQSMYVARFVDNWSTLTRSTM